MGHGSGRRSHTPVSLLEREAELRALTAAIAAAGQGEGRLLWIEGVGGSGTTTLLQAGARAARAAGARVRTGPRGRGGPGHEVLVVDALHAASPDTLRALLARADALHERPAAILAGARPVAPVCADPALVALRDHPAAECLVLRPLSPAAVARLAAERLGADVPDELVDACLDLARGNPAVTHALLAALAVETRRGADAATRVDAVADPVLWHAAQSRLAGLPAAAAAVLEAVALLAPAARPLEVAELAAVEPAGLPALLSMLGTAGLLTRADGIDLLPPRLADAVCARLTADDAVARRRRAARLLAGRAPERAAAHLLHAPAGVEDGDAEILREGAAVAAAQARPGAAAAYLARALEVSPAPERGPVLLELARARAADADHRAADDFRAWLALGEDHSRRATVLHELGQSVFYAGDFAEALGAFREALTALHPDEPAMAAEIRGAIALTALLGERAVREEALAEVQANVSADREPRHPGERVMLTVLAVHRAMRVLDRPGALALAHRAWGGGALRPEDHPEVVGHLLMGVFTFADEHELALELADDAVRRADQGGDGPASALTRYTRAQTLARMGRVQATATDARRAVELGGAGWFVPAARAAAALAALEQGDDAAAVGLLEGGEVPWPEDPWARAVLLELRGDCALVLGRVAEAVEAYAECGRLHDEVLEAPNPAKSLWRSGLAGALHAAGDTARARELLVEQEALARRWGAPSPIGVTLCARAAVERGPAGVALAQEGVALLRDAPTRLRLAGGLMELGALLCEQGDPVAAREPLRDALDVAQACGSVRLAAAARAALVTAGARPRRARTSGVDALTPSERRVAAMAATGLTNREIAEELVVTIKAVRWHLGNAYRKLGVDGREQVAEALGQAG